MVDWEKLPKEFLAGWLQTLMDSMNENLDEESRQKVLSKTGGYCARAHATDLFKKIKLQSNDINELISILNKELKGTKWSLDNGNKLTVIYEKCYCPFINTKLHHSEVQCDCSVGWLKENLEILFNKEINVELKESVVRGGTQCTFNAEI
ncbi:MAG: DUF6144 family protein [Candidatus Thorarchaeota archaeon]